MSISIKKTETTLGYTTNTKSKSMEYTGVSNSIFRPVETQNINTNFKPNEDQIRNKNLALEKIRRLAPDIYDVLKQKNILIVFEDLEGDSRAKCKIINENGKACGILMLDPSSFSNENFDLGETLGSLVHEGVHLKDINLINPDTKELDKEIETVSASSVTEEVDAYEKQAKVILSALNNGVINEEQAKKNIYNSYLDPACLKEINNNHYILDYDKDEHKNVIRKRYTDFFNINPKQIKMYDLNDKDGIMDETSKGHGQN